MTTHAYIFIIKMFLVIMPIELMIVGAFGWACIRNGDTDQPAFWYGLVCIGVLVPEIIRGILIVSGELPPHCKQFQLWLAEMLPFGGFVYEVLKRYFQKILVKFRND